MTHSIFRAALIALSFALNAIQFRIATRSSHLHITGKRTNRASKHGRRRLLVHFSMDVLINAADLSISPFGAHQT
jgi:hypothetical protein